MITGDPGQVDLPRRTIWLKEAILLKDVEGIGIVILMIRILFVTDKKS